MAPKHIVFDIVGTCVSYSAFYAAIDARLGPQLRAHGILPQLLGYAWMESAERECAYLDRTGRYCQFKTMFAPLFYRILWMAGIAEPRRFATDEDVAFLAEAYGKLEAREGVHECMAKLREAGWTIWALTSGDRGRVMGYLERNGIPIGEENFITCDSLGVTKPAPEVYKHVLGKFEGAEETWFAAAHMWDSSAAKHSGFKAAWCSVWEKEPATEVFGEVDVMADTLPEMADGIIAATQK